MWFEFQSKGSNNPQFTDNLGIKDIVSFRDGERVILKINDTIEDKIMGKTWYEVEDRFGKTATINNKNFFKITNSKNFSKKFINFKIEKGIKD